MKRHGLPRLLLAALIATLAGASGSNLTAREPVPQQPGSEISAEALAQIEALIQEKDSRTPVQRKMDSQLIYELKMSQGQPVAPGVETIATDVEYTVDARAIVDVTGTVDDALLQQLRALGAEIIASNGHSARIAADLSILEPIAALPQVTFVQPKQDAVTARVGSTPTRDARRLARRGLARAELTAYFGSLGAGQGPAETAAGTGVGSRSSEGDVTHRAFAARAAFGLDGTGLKIGVLSDGVTNLAASQALGDLGPVTVLAGQAGSGDEGTAMLEIVHDLVPGASLYFATAFSGITSFANNIRALRAAGCDIIVDDVFYFVETPFQDGQAPSVISNTNGGVVIQAVNDVTADGALYFSSAGNSGNLDDGTAGVWEGDFVDGGATGAPVPAGNRLHSFGANSYNVLTVIGSGPLNLYWSDPLGGSSNDYDLFRLNAAGTSVLAASANIQSGTQDPYEQVGAGTTANARVVIVKKAAAAARYLHLNANRGRFSVVTSGQTHGHASAAAAYGVAATPAVGPYPNAFSSSNVTETFSSDGPRRVFYQPDGTPITPGNLSSTGGLVRQKPDITAADGVSVTGVGGFGSPFFGTSAAAPHAAAIAALLKASNPTLTPAQIRSLLTSTAIDIEAPGVDRDSGAGIVMPVLALIASGATGSPYFLVTAAVATEHPGNSNGTVNAGEGASLTVTLENAGAQNAAGVAATLATATPGATLTIPSASAYPDMPAVGGSGSNATPFLFTLAWGVPCPLGVNFTMNLTWTGGSQALPFQVATGPGPLSITANLSAPPPSGPSFTSSTGIQTARLFRDGVASVCGAVKATPALTATGINRVYQAYSMNSCAEATPSCLTVTLAGPNAINLFTAAYVPSFNPSNIQTNYRADPGSSAASRTFAFDFSPATPLAIDVHEVNAGGGTNVAFNLNVSGGCIGPCATPNHVPIARAKNVTVSADASCTAMASVNDGSSDPDGDPLTITQSPAGPYPLGTTSVLLTVTDPFGATSQATGSVTVVDTTGPAVTGFSVQAPPLWPPNHRMVDVVVNYNSTDCTAHSCVLSVKSSEAINGQGDGDTAPDWEVIDAHHVKVRAERSGKGSGRVYTITLTCTDAVGNTTVKTATVKVPKSQS